MPHEDDTPTGGARPERDPWFWARWAIEQAGAKELKPTEAHVLLALARWAKSETGECIVGVERIAAAIRREERRTSETLVALGEKGLIERRRRGPGKTAATRLLEDQDPQPIAGLDPQPVAGLDPQSVADQDQDPQPTAGLDPQPTAGKTRSRPQARPAAHRAHNNQRNNQDNQGSPNPSRRAGARQAPDRQGKGEDDQHLIGKVCSILQGGVDALPENDHGRPWPAPRASEIAQALRAAKPRPELALSAAREAREIVQSQDRAPNISSLFAKKLGDVTREAAGVRGAIADSLAEAGT